MMNFQLGIYAILLLIFASVGIRAQSQIRSALVTLAAPEKACAEASLGQLVSGRSKAGVFEFAVKLSEASTYKLKCGNSFEIFLTPGDRLNVALFSEKILSFTGRGAAANRYLSGMSSLSLKTFATLARLDRPRFIKSWGMLYSQDRRRLNEAARQGAEPSLVARERTRQMLIWAQGRVMYPFFHWRETDAEVIKPDPELPEIVKRLPIEEARWWTLPEFQAFLDAYIHEQARQKLLSEPMFRKGDHRWLRAEFDVATSLLTNPRLRLSQVTRIVIKHVEDDGSKGIDPILERWRTLLPPIEALKKVDELIADDRAQREGHIAKIYQNIDGVPLEVHLLEPTGSEPVKAPRPAMLWFHGGSGTEGIWWHSPGVIKELRNNGVVVVAVEMRTANRFDSGPIEQIEDASAAYHWLANRAAQFNIDREKIGVAGFSSGATIALILATRGPNPASAKNLLAAGRELPSAVLALGGCADPIAKEEDGWFRKQVSVAGSPSAFSPAALVGPGLPKLLAIHGTDDEYCAYAAMSDFVKRYSDAGNDARLSSVRGATHFFGFYYEPGKRQMREAISETLRQWDWR